MPRLQMSRPLLGSPTFTNNLLKAFSASGAPSTNLLKEEALKSSWGKEQVAFEDLKCPFTPATQLFHFYLELDTVVETDGCD